MKCPNCEKEMEFKKYVTPYGGDFWGSKKKATISLWACIDCKYAKIDKQEGI